MTGGVMDWLSKPAGGRAWVGGWTLGDVLVITGLVTAAAAAIVLIVAELWDRWT